MDMSRPNVTVSEKIWHSAQKSDSKLCIPLDSACCGAYSGAVRFAIVQSAPELRARGSYEHGERYEGEFDFLATRDSGRLCMVHSMYSIYQPEVIT